MIIEQLQATPESQNQMLNDEYASFIGESRKQKFSSFENQVMCRTLKQIIQDRDIADLYRQVPKPEIIDPVLMEFLRVAKYVYSEDKYQRYFRNENISNEVAIPSLTGEEKGYIKNLLFKSKQTPIIGDLLNTEVATAIKNAVLIPYGTMEKISILLTIQQNMGVLYAEHC